MYVASRDLRFAKGRFALVVVVVALITALVVLLSGLTEGLGRASTSAISELPTDQIALSAPASGEKASFTTSSVKQSQWESLAETAGVTAAEPFGLSTTRAGGTSSATVTAIGVPDGSGLAPAAVTRGGVVLSTEAAEALCGAAPCGTVTVGGTSVRVIAVRGDASFAHTPVVWMTLPDWQALPGSAGTGSATAVALRTTSGFDAAAVDRSFGLSTTTRDGAKAAIASYTSENGSLQLMRALLFAISALVVGAFFTVWTMQRTPDVAVLKALGASTRYVLLDALAQSLVVLLIGVGLGALVGTLGSLAAKGFVPFAVSASTIALPAVVTVVLGLAGAALSVVRVTRVDPLIALGGVR